MTKKEEKIIQAANKKAAQIIQEAEIFTLEARQYADNELIKSVKEAASKIAEELKADYKTRQIGLEKAIEAEFNEVKQELDVYKAAKIAEIDAKAKGKVKEIIEEFFSENIDIKTQEDAIVKALENAKSKHLF